MIDMIAWFVVAALALFCLSLARRLAETEQELRIERRLRWQSEEREQHAERTRRRLVDINFALAKQKAMYFDGEPTLDATVYTKADWEWVTYDN